MTRRYVRFQHGDRPSWGLIEGEIVRVLSGDAPFGTYRIADLSLPLEGLPVLAPAVPGKILCVGLNYRSHLHGRPAPERPELFFKPPSALVGPGEAIAPPTEAQDVHFEGELVVVIGKRAHRVAPEAAMAHVFGFTCGNDVSERNWQKGDLQWWRAKGCDTFAPLGPWIATNLDLDRARITTHLDGELVQEGTLGDLIFDVPTIVSFASQYLTLEPGDLIYTGTPGSTRNMGNEQVVEVTIEGLGTLRNPVRRS